jgi:hypothetical protein
MMDAVRQSTNPCLVGLSGIVIYESENGFRVVTKGNRLKSGSLSLSLGRTGELTSGPLQCCRNRTASLGCASRPIRRRRRAGIGSELRTGHTSRSSCMETSSGSVLQTGHHESLSTKRVLFCKAAVGCIPASCS